MLPMTALLLAGALAGAPAPAVTPSSYDLVCVLAPSVGPVACVPCNDLAGEVSVECDPTGFCVRVSQTRVCNHLEKLCALVLSINCHR